MTKEKNEDTECNIDAYPEYDNCNENGEYEDSHDYMYNEEHEESNNDFVYDWQYADLTDDVFSGKDRNHNDYTYKRKYSDHTDFVCTVGCKKSKKHVGIPT